MSTTEDTMRIEKSTNELDLIFKHPVYRFCIEINQKCNLNCSYCWDKNNFNNKEINLKTTQKFLDKLYLSYLTWNTPNIIPNISFYAAEPLLSHQIITNLINYLPFRYTILTNGTLLSNEMIKEWNNNFPNIIFSLDGIKKHHNYYRGNTFDKIISNIYKINYEYNNVAMTVNIKSLPYLYDSLCLFFNLPVSNFECQLNLLDNWSDKEFYEYIKIIKTFIKNYSTKPTLPGYSLQDRFSNLKNAKDVISLKPIEANHQLNINQELMITKPQRSCLSTKEYYPYFFGHIIAKDNQFISLEQKKKYELFIKRSYDNYYFTSLNCNECLYRKKCQSKFPNKNRMGVLLHSKECYPILELLILEDYFWN